MIDRIPFAHRDVEGVDANQRGEREGQRDQVDRGADAQQPHKQHDQRQELCYMEGLVGREVVAARGQVEEHLLLQPHDGAHRPLVGEPRPCDIPEGLELEDQEVFQIVADLVGHANEKVRQPERDDDRVCVARARPRAFSHLTRA